MWFDVMALLVAPYDRIGLSARLSASEPVRTLRRERRSTVKLLLTSAGIKNPSINDAMLDLLGKPIAECDALCIPTASYGHAPRGIRGAYRFITGQATTPMCELGWKSLGVLELTALPTLDTRALGPLGRGDRRPARERRGLPVPGPPHAGVGTGRPLALAERGLGRLERRKHGDDPSDR